MPLYLLPFFHYAGTLHQSAGMHGMKRDRKCMMSLSVTGLEGTLGKIGTGGGKKLAMTKINIGKDKKKKKR